MRSHWTRTARFVSRFWHELKLEFEQLDRATIKPEYRRMNPIIKDVSKLMRTLRNADVVTLRDAASKLNQFVGSWTETGDGSNLEGAGECCLADSDLASAVGEVVDVWIDNASE